MEVRPESRLAEAQVYAGFGCRGDNRSPALSWSGAPRGTKSFAVTVYDPDAPGRGWWHWVIYNIPATVTALPAGVGDTAQHLAPSGSKQGMNDFGMAGYGGPCPPAGDRPHRYEFRVLALKVDTLEVSGNEPAARISAQALAQSLAIAHFTAYYSR